MASRSPAKSRSPHWGGGVAGAGTGTSLLVLVSLLPDSHPLKRVLTYTVPSLTLVTSAVWAYATGSIRSWLNDLRINSEIKKANILLLHIEADQQASEQHRKAIRERKEKLELMLIEVHTERVEAIRAVDRL